ncbi:hypothetical protein [Hymenobacter nivis]|uniref:hypothetical protein n=1 Tax=Hymenobacter nivis TaxID=1850093 RepID=UPI00112C41D4|nr:hypothetical protein [Hymenobacter nivis]
MSLVLAAARASLSPAHPEPSFQVSRSQITSAFHQLSLEDAWGCLAHWVVPLPLKHLAKRPMLLWRLPTAGPASALTCLDTGPCRLVPAHPDTRADLRADLDEGLLRLNFSGQLLRGYFRLQCLPEGGGQLWQLTPIGYV